MLIWATGQPIEDGKMNIHARRTSKVVVNRVETLSLTVGYPFMR